jgi:hypothetical protein
MKIQSFRDILLPLVGPVARDRREGSGQGTQQDPGHFEQSSSNDSNTAEGQSQGRGGTGEEKRRFSEQEVAQAVEAFAQDQQAKNNGLQVLAAGSGPGLKVVLKDGTGNVVRQFTGEEFLRLRESASKEGRSRGKLLDQKL